MYRKRSLEIIICGLLMVCLSGCTFVKTETKSENEAEITLSLEDGTEEQNTKQSDLSRGDLLTMFESMSNEDIVSFLYDDYNKDGIHEAFVITKAVDYTVWFMSSDGCVPVAEGLAGIDETLTDLLSYRTKDYVLIQIIENEIPITLMYSVDNDNQVIKPDVSGRGYLCKNDKNELELRVYSDLESKEYCTYYLHYIIDGGFREYGAIPISKEQFLEFSGSEDIIEEITSMFGDNLVEMEFLYRSNHYININILIFREGQNEYQNMTLYYDDAHVERISENPVHGKVEIANMLEIATFPTAFKHPDKKEETVVE